MKAKICGNSILLPPTVVHSFRPRRVPELPAGSSHARVLVEVKDVYPQRVISRVTTAREDRRRAQQAGCESRSHPHTREEATTLEAPSTHFTVQVTFIVTAHDYRAEKFA